MQEKINIKNRKGENVVADLSTPENSKGLAFVLHGLGGFKEQPHMLIIAETFLKHGYAVVNMDATNSFNESGGKYEDATMQNHYEDLVDVISWSENQKWYKEPFILAGHSLGGYAVAQYSEDYPNKVKAVFPHAPVVSGELSHKAHEKFEEEKVKLWKDTGWTERMSQSKPGLVKRLPWSHMEERLKHDLISKVSNLTMSVLFVVGEKDEPCPPEHNKILYDLIPGEKEFHIIAGAPHTFRDSEHLEQLRNILSTWINKIN